MFRVQTNRARYYRLIEKPSKLSFAEHGDVSGGVQVCMESEPAFSASVIVSFPISLVDMPTVGAFLTGVPRVDIDDDFSESFGLVVYKALELSETPTTKRLIERMSKSLFTLDAEGFECYCIERLIDYLLTDAMVHIDHKAFLPANELLEFSLGRTSPFGLETTAIILVSSRNSPNTLTVEEDVVRQDRLIVDTSIDTENFAIYGSDNLRCFSFRNHPDYQPSAVERNQCGLDFPIDILVEVFWNIDWNLHPAMNATERHDGLITIERERPHVVSNSSVRSFDWQPFTFFTLEHVRCAVSCGCGEGCWQTVFLTDGIVRSMVELELVVSLGIEPDLENIIGGLVEYTDGFDNSTVGFCIQGDCSLHSDTSLVNGAYKYSVKVTESINSRSTIHPTTEVRGFPYGGVS